MMKVVMHRIYQEYLMRDRTHEMDQLLGWLDDLGYEFYSVLDFSRAVKSSVPLPEKTCLIRVDIDGDPDYCNVMSRVFKKNGCAATFYFRLETIDREIMHDLEQQGFEVGYHYEELATVAKQLHLKTQDGIMARIEDCRDLFRENLAQFNQILSSPSKTVASHGDFANRSLGLKNTVIVNQALKDEFGLEAEAYDEDLVSRIDDSIIDRGSPIWWEPYSPQHAIEKHGGGRHCLRILFHPKQWRTSFYWNTRQNIDRAVQGLRY